MTARWSSSSAPRSTRPRPWVKLEPDAVCAITRDYLDEPTTGRRMEWHIECLDPDPDGWRLTDEDLARRFRAATTWFDEQAAMAPVDLADPNTVAEPYPVPTETFGWAAGDAAYAMGSFALADDEALVIRGRSPDCAFWNVLPVERAPPHLQLRLLVDERAGHPQRHADHLRGGRFVGARGGRAGPGRPQLGVHPGPRPRAHLVPVVPARGDAGATHHRGRQAPDL